jgi:hypothetical protein
MMGSTSKNGYIHELNIAPAFFGLTINAHWLDALMRLNKFFDKQERHLSVYQFLDFVEQNLDVFSNQAFEKRVRDRETLDVVIQNHVEVTSQMVEQDRQKLTQLPIRNLRKWRNMMLAHIEKESLLRDINVPKQYPVKVAQIDEIINTLDEMLNDYSGAYDANIWIKELPLEGGIQRVMDAVRFSISEERKQWELEYKKGSES